MAAGKNTFDIDAYLAGVEETIAERDRLRASVLADLAFLRAYGKTSQVSLEVAGRIASLVGTRKRRTKAEIEAGTKAEVEAVE